MIIQADEWQDLLQRARAAANGDEQGAGDENIVVAALAEHMSAPIRASLTCTMGDIGVFIRLTLVDDRVLLVVDPIAAADEEVTVSPEVQLIFANISEMWAILSSALPPIDCLRARTTQLRGAAPEELNLTVEERDTFFDQEQANLQVIVEAWDEDTKLVQWGNWWSVVDDHLYSISTVERQLVIRAWQPGAVALVFRQTMVGAFDVVGALASQNDVVSESVGDGVAA